MNTNFLYISGYLAAISPFLAVAVVLVHYYFRRTAWKAKQLRRKSDSRFCPSASALGMILLFVQVFYRPTVSYVLEVKQEETEEDDQGDPETLAKQLNRQLRRIRQGEAIDQLVLRL